MDVKTLSDLIDWTRQRHADLAQCLGDCAAEHKNERATVLLEYLADHEARLEQLIDKFETQGDAKAMGTYIYDHMAHTPLKMEGACDPPFAEMRTEDISQAVLREHEQIMDLYRSLISRSEIPEAKNLLEAILDMEKNETMQLSQQTGRMDAI